MNDTTPIEAVVSDMDGVLTSTATLHERAWQQMFDEFLRRRLGEGFPPFTGRDYRAHVDGKPRYDGVRDFLASRGIRLAEGVAADAPTQETVSGLGNRKNEMFQQLLGAEGIRAFDDAVPAITRWRRGGLPVAVVSASRNCRQILDAADLLRFVDLVVDGRTADELNLAGKQGILEEAARQLDLAPARAVVLEDAVAGVAAARAAAFGCVIGIARGGHGDELIEAGADSVVPGLHRAAFPRRIPALEEHLDDVRAWRGHRTPALFLDFDGTLSPIVDDPAAAMLPDPARAALTAVAGRWPIAVISGRDRADVAARVGIDELWYAGNHGFDIAGHGHRNVLPEAEQALPRVAAAAAELDRRLAGVSGVIIEHKRFSVAIHYRRIDDPAVREHVKETVADVHAATALRKRAGKEVLELEPDVAWNKGYALRWLMDVMGIDATSHFVVYVGDDVTDEDAFAALAGSGMSVLVGDGVSSSLADYRVASPDQVGELPARLE